MTHLRNTLAGIVWHLRYRRGRMAARLRRWFDPLAGSDVTHYKSAREIALDNAAAALGQDPDFPHVEDWEMPREGLDYDPVELPPDVTARMDAWGEEMSLYMRRQHSRRKQRKRARRRRIGVAVVGGAVLVGGAGAGAHALGLRVPVVEDAFELLAAGRKPINAQRSGPGRRGVRLAHPMVGVGGAGPPLELTSALGERFRAIPYQAGRSLVCVRTVRVAKSGTVDKSLGGCMPFARIAQATNTRAGIVEGITVGETVVLTGYASSDVEAIRGRGPDTAIRANVTPTWTPDAITVPGFRVFIATTSLDVGRDGLDLDDEARATNLWNYKLRAVLKNGRTVPIPP